MAMRFSSAPSKDNVEALTEAQVMAMAEQRQGAAADAFAASSSWVFSSQYAAAEGGVRAAAFASASAGAGKGKGKGKTGPIGKMEPKLREEIDAGMRGTGLPRLYAASATALHERLSKEVPVATHQLSSRLSIGPMMRRLTLTLYRRLMAKLAKPLVASLSKKLHKDLSQQLVKPLALSVTQSLSHDPKTDLYCALCLYGSSGAKAALSAASGPAVASSLFLNDTFYPLEGLDPSAPSAVDRFPQEYLSGPYCQSCRLARRRARALSEHVSRLTDEGSANSIISEAGSDVRLRPYVKQSLSKIEALFAGLSGGK